MNYFKINYDKLKNLKQLNFYWFGIVILILLIAFILSSLKIKVTRSYNFYGVMNDGVLKIIIDNKLSDTIKNGNTLEFNNIVRSYEVVAFGDYELINGAIMQEVDLKIDGSNYNNEVGKVKIYYNEEKLCDYLLELFK